MLMTNSISYPIFKEKAYKLGFIYLNSFSISLVHQYGKTKYGKIISYSGTNNMPDDYAHKFTVNQSSGDFF